MFLEASLYCSFAPSSVLAVMAAAGGIALDELLATAVTGALKRRLTAPRRDRVSATRLKLHKSGNNTRVALTESHQLTVRRHRMAEYTLPDLPYDYGALEPHISGKIMELHHDKHHNTYVTGLNTAIDALAEAREQDTIGTTALLWEKNLAFNYGGHINHSVFWHNLSPDGGDKPTGELASAIDRDFGSFDLFQKHFTSVATTIQGSGWAILGVDTLAQKLRIFQLYDQQANVPLGIVPVVMLDMWEHAFYLDYLNVKPDYVKAWWNVVNWADAAQRFEKAQGVSLV